MASDCNGTRYVVWHITAHIAYAAYIQALLDERVLRRGVVEIHTVTKHNIRFCVHNHQTANIVYTEIYYQENAYRCVYCIPLLSFMFLY